VNRNKRHIQPIMQSVLLLFTSAITVIQIKCKKMQKITLKHTVRSQFLKNRMRTNAQISDTKPTCPGLLIRTAEMSVYDCNTVLAQNSSDNLPLFHSLIV